MTNLIATDAQTQEIDSGLIDLFEITLPNGTLLRLHPGEDDDLTNIQFRNSTAPTNPVSAGNFVVGNTYTIVSGTGFTSIGASNNNAGTSFVATGVGSGQRGCKPNRLYNSRIYSFSDEYRGSRLTG